LKGWMRLRSRKLSLVKMKTLTQFFQRNLENWESGAVGGGPTHRATARGWMKESLLGIPSGTEKSQARNTNNADRMIVRLGVKAQIIEKQQFRFPRTWARRLDTVCTGFSTPVENSTPGTTKGTSNRCARNDTVPPYNRIKAGKGRLRNLEKLGIQTSPFQRKALYYIHEPKYKNPIELPPCVEIFMKITQSRLLKNSPSLKTPYPGMIWNTCEITDLVIFNSRILLIVGQVLSWAMPVLNPVFPTEVVQ